MDDNSFSVPDLLATDALLDRLGRHEATGGDLADAVARLLDSYALHADPETAGVRPVELPDLDAELEHEPAHVPAPRVLLARAARSSASAAAPSRPPRSSRSSVDRRRGRHERQPARRAGRSVSASIASQLPGGSRTPSSASSPARRPSAPSARSSRPRPRRSRATARGPRRA